MIKCMFIYLCIQKRRIWKRVESGSTPESVENYMLALEKRRDERVGYM